MDADTDISATTKVLGTVELLENVLLHVQPDCLPALKSVSETWHGVISSSPIILSIIKCLVPESRDESGLEFFVSTPTYGQGSLIAIHPALGPHNINCSDARADCRVILRFTVRDIAYPKLQKLKAEFVTRPFCQDLQVYHKAAIRCVPPYSNFVRGLHIKAGIRFGHLLKVCDELAQEIRRTSNIPWSQNESVRKDEFFVRFRERMSKADMAEFKRLHKLRPVDGRWFTLQTQWPVIKGGRKIESG